MKVEELEGAELDYWVAKAECLLFRFQWPQWPWAQRVPPYSSDWSQGGPIIERERIEVHPRTDRGYAEWGALPQSDSGESWERMQRGGTPLVAAMRVYVASKLGEEVGKEQLQLDH